MYLAICDDQAGELELLSALLETWQQERRTPLRWRAFRSAGQLLEAAQRERFTLYLLDVMMPGMDGLEAAQEIRCFDAAADIVFLTSSPGFAYESYSVRALEYLLKPITPRLLFPLLDRLARSDAHQSAEFISIFYGEDVTEEQAQKAEAIFTAACPNAEVSLLSGGQPVYYYMISAE